VPDHATLLVAWLNLPGENTQRSRHWAQNKAWKDTLKQDFAACLDFQGHPGLLRDPAIHIALHVSRRGDDNNLLARAKYVIDLLQVCKTRVDGQRVQGLLDLIENDDLLTPENRSIEECAVRSTPTGKRDKYDRPIKEAPYRVLVWAWDRAC
jgi:hypothetical protein